MQPLVVLDSHQVAVEPGGETRLPVRVRNPGTIVEAYNLDVVGAASEWATAEPATVSVYPGQEAEAEIVFRPPRAATTPLGLLPFGVRAVSEVDASQSVVEEGELEVGGVVDLAVVLVPRNSKGRWRGKHRLEIENNGNSPVTLAISTFDPDEQLSIRAKPQTIDLGVGDYADAKLKAKIRSPFLRGPATPRPFQVQVDEVASDEMSRRRIGRDVGYSQTFDGSVGQRQIIGGSLIALTALLVLGVGAYFLFTSLNDDDGQSGEEAGQAVPRPPDGLTAAATSTEEIRLTWVAPTGDEQGFDVLQIVDGASRTLQANLPRGDTTYVVAGLEPSTEYCFALRSFNAVGRSDPTQSQCATTATPEAPLVPPAPSGVTVVVSDEGAGQRIELAWTDRTETGAETAISENDTQIAILPVGRTSIELGRAPGRYCYELRSVIDDVPSPPAEDGGGVSRFCTEIQPPAPVVSPGTIGYFIQLGTLYPIPEPLELDSSTDTSTFEELPVDDGSDTTVLVTPTLVAGSLEDAETELTSWQQQGHAGAILVITDHVGIPGDPSWAVIVPGFASDEQANQYCIDQGVQPCRVWSSD